MAGKSWRDKMAGQVHAVTTDGDALCGTVGKSLRGTKNMQSVSCMKCKRFIRAGKLKQDQNGLFELSDEDRDKLTYGEGSFKIGQKTKK